MCIGLLIHWGRVAHICVGKLTIIDSDNGLSAGRRQAIIWTIAGTLLIGPLGTDFSEILIEISIFSLGKMHLKMSGNWRPFCLGLNVLTVPILTYYQQDFVAVNLAQFRSLKWPSYSNREIVKLFTKVAQQKSPMPKRQNIRTRVNSDLLTCCYPRRHTRQKFGAKLVLAIADCLHHC